MEATTTRKDRDQVAEVINDLVRINNDRMEGYEKAIKETKSEDADLVTLFGDMKAQSSKYRLELSSLASSLGADPEDGTRLDGKIYRAWMDVKATFSGHSRKSVLENCEFGEDAAGKAYASALEENGLPVDIRNIIVRQQSGLMASHDKIKALRDSEK